MIRFRFLSNNALVTRKDAAERGFMPKAIVDAMPENEQAQPFQVGCMGAAEGMAVLLDARMILPLSQKSV